MTPLHLAALHDAPWSVMRLLVKMGADPGAVNAEGDTAAEVSVVCVRVRECVCVCMDMCACA
jgi:ankyrin repeat protein